MKKLLIWALAGILCTWVKVADAQNNTETTAIAGGTVIKTKGGYTPMAIVYNPEKNIYYALEGGTSLANLVTYSTAGNRIDSVPSGFDYRGVWWNRNTHQIEGNGFKSKGIVSDSTNSSTGLVAAKKYSVIFDQNIQPADQSKAAYDTVKDQIVYYHQGNIYRYARKDYSALPVLPVKNLPVSIDNLSPYTILATGVSGKEYGVLDAINNKVYFINAEGQYAGTCKLPYGTTKIDQYGISYCNGYLWLYNSSSWCWSNYQIITDNKSSDIPPALTASNGSANFLSDNQNSKPADIDANITITDNEQENLQSAVIKITANATEGDILSFKNDGSMGNITSAYNNYTLSLIGNATVAQWQSALRSVKFNNTNEGPSLAMRTVSFTVNNGLVNSNTVTKNIQMEVPRGSGNPDQNSNAVLVVHQAISPNGDGINDYLQIDGIEKYTSNKVLIVNRSGALIAEINGYDNSTKVFDGHNTLTHQMQEQGSYLYMIQYVDNGVQKKQSGFLVLKY